MRNALEHGVQCECTLLAEAVGIRPRDLTFDYCRRILQKRWHVTCRHGCDEADMPPAPLAEHWRNTGQVDAVRAILISNDQ